MPKSNEKINVRRLLDDKRLSYVEHNYPPEEAVSAEGVVAYLGQNPTQAFKTLITVGKLGQHHVFVAPGSASLSLRGAAKAVGKKSIVILSQRDLLPLAGHVHGGRSPIGMKEFLPTVVDASAEVSDSTITSAGKRGYQVEPSPVMSGRLIRLSYAAFIE